MSQSGAQSRPLVSVAVSPKTDSDPQRFRQALNDITRQDPAVRIKAGSFALEAIICGTDELHLESVCDRILHEYKIPIDIGEPAVVYVETIRRSAEAEGKYIRQMGGSGNYGHVKIKVEPNEAGKGFEFINEIKGDMIAEKYLKPIEQGIREALEHGILSGCEIVDVKVTLLNGSYHEIDSNELAFKIAGSMAFRKAAIQANPVLLEPVMAVEVDVLKELAGTVIGDLNSRRGRIEGIEDYADLLMVRAVVPLAEMLSSTIEGRVRYGGRFLRYEPVPRHDPPGGDDPGVTANRPTRPKAGRGFAAVRFDEEFE
jgi:elongation factor G